MAKGNGIKKISYSTIRKELVETGFASDAYFMVEENPFEKGMYMITVYHAAYPYSGRHIAMGKSLKGYKGDIIRLKYDGYCFPCGDYLLESDQHGLICKFKRSTEEFLADLKPQIEAKKKEIAIYKQNNGEENPKLLKMINQCREEIISLLIKRDEIKQKGTWRTSPDAYYQGKIEEWINI